MDYQAISKQLGDALLKTPQYEGLQAAQDALEQDLAAQILLQSLEEVKEEMREIREQGQKLPRQLLAKIEQLQEGMAKNQALKDYNQALAGFQEVLKKVNDTLTEKTGIPVSQGCGGCPKKRA